MSRQPRAGTAASNVTIRATSDERAQWERAAKQAGHLTISAAVVKVMNAWAGRVLKRGEKSWQALDR